MPFASNVSDPPVRLIANQLAMQRLENPSALLSASGLAPAYTWHIVRMRIVSNAARCSLRASGHLIPQARHCRSRNAPTHALTRKCTSRAQLPRTRAQTNAILTLANPPDVSGAPLGTRDSSRWRTLRYAPVHRGRGGTTLKPYLRMTNAYTLGARAV